MDGGYSLTLGASALRNLVRVIDAQPLFTYAVGMVAAVASRRGKRLGDVVAGTVVVRERVVRAGPAAPARAAAAVPGPPAPVGATLLDDDRFAVLERYVARRGALEPGRAAALAAQLAAHLRPALDALAREEGDSAGVGPRGRAAGDAAALGRLLARERRRARAAPWSRARAARGAPATPSSPRGASAGAASPRASPRPAAAGSPPSPKTR
jgi:hypothetical protein